MSTRSLAFILQKTSQWQPIL